MPRRLPLLLLALLVAPLAAEVGPVLRLRVPPEAPRLPIVPPGRAEPVAASPAFTCRIRWDVADEDYVSLLVVEEGEGLRRPAYVATFKRDGPAIQVAYTGTAFRDAAGTVHIDCRKAHITGPAAHHWSADSFAIAGNGQVEAIDDADRGNVGQVLGGMIPPAAVPVDTRLHYRRERLLARALVEGVL